jgi:hypothetical protein
MEERYVRCRRCHDVFEAGQLNCPRCGAAYVPIEEPAPGGTTFAERYSETPLSAPFEQPAAAAPRQERRPIGMLLAMGALLVVAAVVVWGLALAGVFGPAATEEPQIIVPIPSKPTPSPTLPVVVGQTLAQIQDPMFNAHVSMKTTMMLNARVNGKSQTAIYNMEVDLADGQEMGTLQVGASKIEFRLASGTYYSRALPNGKWEARTSVPSYMVLLPLFAITDMKQIAFDAPDTAHGGAYRIVGTRWYNPDVGKLTSIDVASLGIAPQKESLTLWIDDRGQPVYAEFHAWTDSASDGTRLLDIVTTYEFTNVGTVNPFGTPGPSPTPTK